MVLCKMECFTSSVKLNFECIEKANLPVVFSFDLSPVGFGGETSAYALCALRDGISGYRIQELVDAGCHRYLNSRDIREVDGFSIQPVEKLLLCECFEFRAHVVR